MKTPKMHTRAGCRKVIAQNYAVFTFRRPVASALAFP